MSVIMVEPQRPVLTMKIGGFMGAPVAFLLKKITLLGEGCRKIDVRHARILAL
jgi:hypothetical protein